MKVPTIEGLWISVDSCEVTHGTFAMKGHLDSVAIATLFVDDTPLIPIVLEEGVLNVSLTGLAYRVSGTPYYNRGLARLFLGQNEQGTRDLSKAGELGLYGAYNLIKRFGE